VVIVAVCRGRSNSVESALLASSSLLVPSPVGTSEPRPDRRRPCRGREAGPCWGGEIGKIQYPSPPWPDQARRHDGPGARTPRSVRVNGVRFRARVAPLALLTEAWCVISLTPDPPRSQHLANTAAYQAPARHEDRAGTRNPVGAKETSTKPPASWTYPGGSRRAFLVSGSWALVGD